MSLTDEQAKKIFMDGQVRLQDLTKQLNNCRNQIFTRDRDARMCDATLQQLSKMDQPVTYKTIGKIFMRVEANELQEQLKTQAEKDRRDVNVLQKTKEYLEKNILDQEKSLREMLERRREQE